MIYIIHVMKVHLIRTLGKAWRKINLLLFKLIRLVCGEGNLASDRIVVAHLALN